MPRRQRSKVEEPIEGFPKQGEAFPDDPPAQGDPGDEDNPPAPTKEPPVSEAETMSQVELRLRKEYDEKLESLRRQIPPVQPKEPAVPPAETDWDNLMFTNPKEAVKLIKQQTAREIEERMTSQYNKDQGTRKFWDGFYEQNKDLKEDHDLVEITLNSNLAALANIPVSEAMKKLADLTRDRLLRYSGGVKPKGKKAFAEGSGTPGRKAAPEEDAEVTSLSDIIKARRLRRRATAA